MIATGIIAWPVGRGWSICWHITKGHDDMSTLCGLAVPPGKVSRTRHGRAPTCQKCVKALDRMASQQQETR